MGKDGFAYLLDRSNLGGITAPVDSFHVTDQGFTQAAATYRTTKARMLLVALANLSSRLSALLQPPHLKSTSLTDGVWGKTDAARLLSRQRVAPIT